MKTISLSFFAVALTVNLFTFAAPAAAKLGVLVVAEDRGAVGNQEIAAAVADLDPDYPVELLLIGRDVQGVEKGYADYIAAASNALKRKGVDEALAVPLFVAPDDALLSRFKEPIESSLAPAALTWAPALGEDYLAREILIDLIRGADPDRKAVRLVLLMSGASDAENAAKIKSLGEALVGDIAPIFSFSEATVAIDYSDNDGDEAARSDKGTALIRAASPDETVLVVPFMIGVKFTPMMSLKARLSHRYSGDGVILADTVMPHPAARTWLRRMINAAAPPSDKTIGVIIMPHGSTAPYNDGVVAAMPRSIIERYPTAYAFGMASPFTIEQAVRELESAGVRHAVFLRLFSMPDTFRERSDYVLGLSLRPPTHSHGGVPKRVRTAIRFVTSGGYQSDPLISGILKDRILEVSKNPSHESVILLSHGAMSDAVDAANRAVVEGNIADINAAFKTPFRSIRAMSLREDWPEKREQAVRDIRAAIETANVDGRAIVVSNRLYGAGSYADYLGGIDYVMSGKGLIPHPNFTRWVEKTLQEGIAALKSGAEGDLRDGEPTHHH